MNEIKVGSIVERVSNDSGKMPTGTRCIVEGLSPYERFIQVRPLRGGNTLELRADCFKSVKQELEDAQVGDILIKTSNIRTPLYRRVRGVVGEMAIVTIDKKTLAEAEDTDTHTMHPFNLLRRSGWELYTKEEEKVEELTMEQVCKELGREVKIKK